MLETLSMSFQTYYDLFLIDFKLINLFQEHSNTLVHYTYEV